MAQNIEVNFKVNGGQLKEVAEETVAYGKKQIEIGKEQTEISNRQLDILDEQRKKTQNLIEEQERLKKQFISGTSHAHSGKDQIKLIEEEISAIEKKNRLTEKVKRYELITSRRERLDAVSAAMNEEREYISKDKKLSLSEKEEAFSVVNREEGESRGHIKKQSQDELALLREEEHSNKITVSLLKEQLDAIKKKADEQIKAVISGDTKLSDVLQKAQTDEEKLIAKLTKEGVEKEHEKEKKNESKESLFASLLGVDTILKTAGRFGQLSQSRSGFDMIEPATSILGTAIGGISGALLGALSGTPFGVAAGASGGAAVGNAIASSIGGLKQREELAKQDFLKLRNKYAATTGSNQLSLEDLSEAGIGMSGFMQMQTQFARQRGNAASSEATTRQALLLERGYGVDQSTSSTLIELQRSARGNNKDLSELIGGVITKGQQNFFKNGDTTFLNEFLNKFSTVQKELLKTQTHVATGTTFDILAKFNGLGGAFDLKDSRSLGLINTINSSLANPNSDFKKSLSFYALRKDNPDMNQADLIEEQQRGLSSPKYLASVMKMIDRMGGSESAKRMNFAGYFGLEQQQAFATELYNGFKSGKLNGSISQEELKSKIEDIKQKAESLTTSFEQQTAKIENAVLDGSAVKTISDALSAALKSSLQGSVIEMKDGNRFIIKSNVDIMTENVAAKARQQKSETIRAEKIILMHTSTGGR